MAWPLKDIHRATLAVCLGSLSCWKVSCSLRLSQYVGALSISSTLTSPSVPVAEKQPHSMRLLPAHFTFGMYSAADEQSWCPSDMILGIEVHQTRESCSSESVGPLGCICANSRCVFMD